MKSKEEVVKSSYRQIFKATSLFGGVQVITIIISIIRSKFVAIWLGSAGVGVMSLLNAPLGIITTLTGFGLSVSAIREISQASANGDNSALAKIIKTFRRWVWFTGLLGMIITIILSPYLSYWSFSNTDYVWSFVFLSGTLLLTDISNGQSALLQGTRRLKEMGQSKIIGVVLGLFTSLPLYYFYGLEGIVPSIIITAFSSLILSWYYSRKIKLEKVEITYKESYKNGLDMVKLGIFLTLSGLIGTAIRYLISAYISREGGVDQVGLYQAGFGLITGYVGIVFTAMATDYFPRLAGTNNNKDSIEIINQQIEMSVLIIAPICVSLTIALPIVVKLLYTVDFLSIIPMLEWFLLSIIIKGVVWAVGFLYLARADYSTSFKIDNITNAFLLGGYIGMYYLMGLEGIGIAEFILYCLGFVLSYYYANKKYGFALYRETVKIILLSLIISIAVFGLLRFLERNLFSYILSIILLCYLSFSSFKSLNQRLDIKSLIYKYLKKVN